MMRLLICTVLVAVSLTARAAGDESVKVEGVDIHGKIDGANIRFTLEFTATLKGEQREVAAVSGDVAVEEVKSPDAPCRLRFDAERKTYFLTWARAGEHHASLQFSARPQRVEAGPWRSVAFTVPASLMRKLAVECDKTDLKIRFPGALRQTREVKDGVLSVTAVLGPGVPFAVEWKPEVQQMAAKLVVASTTNSIATISPGTLRIDSVYLYEISQGQLDEVVLRVPAELAVTQVVGKDIRHWQVDGEGDARRLSVGLTQPQTKQYALEVFAEMALPRFPAEVTVPVIRPEEGIRASGHLVVGTDSAVQLVVKRVGGLSQLEPTAFPLMLLERDQARGVPRQKSFFYSYATTPYQIVLALDDMVPSYDVSQRLTAHVRDDDLVITADLELDVRDAPLREVGVMVDKRFIVAAVEGDAVGDYNVTAPAEGAAQQQVRVTFKKPLLGRALVKMRLELGKTPLDAEQQLHGIGVTGARNERGFLVLVADPGVIVEAKGATELREVHLGSLPVAVPNAEQAWRFRQADWSLALAAHKKQAGLLAEAFHLISAGEGMLYGYTVVNYVISGAPVDELHFRIPEELRSVEFVGADVREPAHKGDAWTIKLRRKVVGEYSLALAYNRPYKSGDVVDLGVIECEDTDTHTGYICLASQLNLEPKEAAAPDASVLAIKRAEIPDHYRLLVNAPILSAYKYVRRPHRVHLQLDAFERGSVLPIVVELMDLRTQISVREKGTAESVTVARYKIKNSNRQYLRLAMPKGAVVWATRATRTDERGQESFERVTASFDKEKSVLMVPLERRRDPNNPVTVEVEYGETHPGTVGGGTVALTAPRSEAKTTYANWYVSVPENWAVLAAGGNMVPPRERAEELGLANVLSRTAQAWLRTLASASREGLLLLAAGGFVVVLLLVELFVARWAMAQTIAVVLLVAVVCVGAAAATRAPFPRCVDSAEGRLVEFTQAVALGEKEALSASVRVVPTWRQHATIFGAIVIPALGLLCLAGAWRLRRLGNGRMLLAALGAVALAYGAAQFEPAAVVLAHLVSWGAAAAVLVVLLLRTSLHAFRRSRALAAAAALLAVGFLLTGCAGNGLLPKQLTVDAAEYQLSAEKDTMVVNLHLTLSGAAGGRVHVMPQTAVLVSSETPAPKVKIGRNENAYVVETEEGGTKDVTLQFLAPLSDAGENGARLFRIPSAGGLRTTAVLTVPEVGLDVVAPSAARLATEEVGETTRASAVLGPEDEIVFAWRPRARERTLEKTVFYVDVASVFRCDVGVMEGHHRLRFQIAQGVLKDARVRVPDGAVVTSVRGDNLGAWRFDPATHELEARLVEPVGGQYVLDVVTQVTHEEIPYNVELQPLTVADAERQRSILGVYSTAAVQLAVEGAGQRINIEDFTREAASLAPEAGAPLRYAYRLAAGGKGPMLTVSEVKPEVRAHEEAGFSVADDRLVYTATIAVEVAKAGVFSLDLLLPAGYDIDALAGADVSHWDDVEDAGGRRAQVHFRRKLLGATVLRVGMSRAEAEMPSEVLVPRVEVVGAVKHEGAVIVTSERGVRLTVAERRGVSELNALDLGVRQAGALAFKLLRPDWQLTLKTEVIKPRIDVEFLHVARVSDGIVRHAHYLYYTLRNAGVKAFEVDVPEGALGLSIHGPEIASLRVVPDHPGRWRVELTQKRFGRPYPLRLEYETQYDREAGDVKVQPAAAVDANTQRGHVVVYTTARVEVAPATVPDTMRPEDARGLPRMFGAGDLSGAALCYAGSDPTAALLLRAKRHDAAALLEAEVLSAAITSVVNESGESLHHVRLQLRVGAKRHLEARLPQGATIWSLLVNLRPEVPSFREGAAGKVALIPLAQGALGDLPVDVDLIYVVGPETAWSFARQVLHGPEFDLPLKNVEWRLFLPEGFVYDDFEGSLTVDEKTLRASVPTEFDLGTYEKIVKDTQSYNRRRAIEYQSLGNKLAAEGQQHEAKQALERANAYSQNDFDLNEDTRVQLHNLIQQQAVVGIVGRRGQLSQQKPGAPAQAEINAPANFSQEQAQRLQNSLSKSENENLERIANRLILMQEQAAGTHVQLLIHVPVRGREIRFDRPLQVRPDTEMVVRFTARAEVQPELRREPIWAAGLFVALLILLALGGLAGRARPKPIAPETPPPAPPLSPEPEPPAETPSKALALPEEAEPSESSDDDDSSEEEKKE